MSQRIDVGGGGGGWGGSKKKIMPGAWTPVMQGGKTKQNKDRRERKEKKMDAPTNNSCKNNGENVKILKGRKINMKIGNPPPQHSSVHHTQTVTSYPGPSLLFVGGASAGHPTPKA